MKESCLSPEIRFLCYPEHYNINFLGRLKKYTFKLKKPINE